MTKALRSAVPLAIGGLFLFLDRWLKWQSTHEWANEKVLNKFLGWFPSYNVGIAFGWPMQNTITVLFTGPIIILVAYLLYKNYHKVICNFSLSLAFFGALSNFYDRLLQHAAIDYFLFFTLIFNIADVMIVGGLLLYFFYDAKYKKCYMDF